MLLYSSSLLIEDLTGSRIKRFDVSTAYTFLLMITSLSHLIALFGLSDNPFYFTRFYSPFISNKAIFIFNLGSIITIETMRRFLKAEGYEYEHQLASEKFQFWLIFIISLSIFAVAQIFSQRLLSLGLFGSFIIWIVQGSVLLLSFLAHLKNRHVVIVLLYTLFLSVWALQYAYLRMEILIPWVAYLTGNILASRSIKGLHFYSKVIIVAGFIIFPPLFTFLGENREKLWGRDKLNLSVQALDQEQNIEGQTFMSRLSIIPQISHIIRLTEKNGYYEGKTLNYLGYVFIPRFIWPEKPLIRQGQWFALEIGNAYKDRQGRINNSINMTVPGEFYLNYGWAGLVFGCIVFGWLIAWIWKQTNYHSLYGWVFRFYLIFLGLFSLGADLQIVPTLIAYWVIYKLIIFIRPEVKYIAERRTINPGYEDTLYWRRMERK